MAATAIMLYLKVKGWRWVAVAIFSISLLLTISVIQALIAKTTTPLSFFVFILLVCCLNLALIAGLTNSKSVKNFLSQQNAKS